MLRFWAVKLKNGGSTGTRVDFVLVRVSCSCTCACERDSDCQSHRTVTEGGYMLDLSDRDSDCQSDRRRPRVRELSDWHTTNGITNSQW